MAMDTLPDDDAATVLRSGSAHVTAPILPDVVEEARRLVAAADEAGLRVRLIGGAAVRVHGGADFDPSFVREIRDIDLVTGKGDGRRAEAFLESQGYVANRTFNAMHGARRLLFYDEGHDRQVDVFINTFEMCHILPVGEHLDVEHQVHPQHREQKPAAGGQQR